MIRYVSRRLLQSALILLGVSFITFFLLYILPADPAQQIAGRSATPETIANIRVQLGLDQPLFVQYWHYLVNLVHGNFGRSYIQRTDVSELLASRLGPTLYLMLCSILIELVIGITAGVIAAVKRGKTSDNAIMLFSFIGVSAPQFILSILMLYVFAVKLKWFPIGGYGTPEHFVLPALTLGILGSGWYGRVMRSSMLDVLRQDYIRTSRAKGASELRVVLVHSLRNAILPIVAMIGLDIGIFMGGVVVVESVFAWPGIGQLAWQAIQRVDIPIIMGVTLVSAIAIVLGNLLADLLSPLVDPRIKLNR
jgi:ABC-type dipeptide/oligopeptide/nickel transport systems, permease components